jgi:glycosyltransferase involved in cell wall biosynthesis
MTKLKLCTELVADERWLGGLIYIENLLLALSELPEVDQPRVELSVLSKPAPHLIDRIKSLDIVRHNVKPINFVERVSRSLDCKLGSRLSLLRSWLGLVNLSNRHDLWFPALERTAIGRPVLYWIPDFQHHYLPHLFSIKELKMRSRCYSDIAAGQGLLLLSSHTALEDFNTHYPNAKVNTCVWSFCSNIKLSDSEQVDTILKKYALPEKYLYIPNQFWQHKDHLTAFDAIRRLREAGLRVPLVCTGYHGDYRDTSYFPRVEKFLEDHGLIEQIRLLGVIPREDQLSIFRSAALVVQPSLFEGWSTVIEDAKAIGRPVLASDTRIHREQLTDSSDAAFFKAGDASALAKQIADLWRGVVPGPNLTLESKAAILTAKRRLESAKHFISIAHEAVELYKSNN